MFQFFFRCCFVSWHRAFPLHFYLSIFPLFSLIVNCAFNRSYNFLFIFTRFSYLCSVLKHHWWNGSCCLFTFMEYFTTRRSSLRLMKISFPLAIWLIKNTVKNVESVWTDSFISVYCSLFLIVTGALNCIWHLTLPGFKLC